jgi:TonB dependent receptor
VEGDSKELQVKNRKLEQNNSNRRSSAPCAWGTDCLLTVSVFRIAFFVLLLINALAVQHASAASQNEPFTVRAADANGEAMPGIDIILMRDGKVLDRMRTGSDGRASIEVSTEPLIVSIHQNGYIPIDQAVDPASIPEHLLEIRLLPTPQAHETVNVQASNEDITEQTSSPGASIKPQEVNESPLRPLTLIDTLPLVPGVVRAPNGQTQIEGSGEMHSALVVDSVDAVDPATGRFGLSVPIDVVDSLHVLTSPYLAQYGRFTAGLVTAETKPGGNKWHYDLNDPLPEFRIRSGHLRGLKSATPRLSFGGPIVQDHAFFSEGLELVDNKIPIRTLQFPFNETKITSANSFTQADFILTPQQTLTTSLHAVPQNVRYANLDFFNPQEVTPNGDTRSYTGIITHRLAIGEGLLQSTISLSYLNTAISPQGTLGMTVLSTGNNGNYFANQQRHSRRFEWNELWSLKSISGLGIHKIQFGSSLANANDEGQLHAKTVTMFDNQGTKIRTIDFTSGSQFDRGDQQPAIFVQDHWAFNSHLAIDAGVRAEAQTITATTRIAPRMGFVWNPSQGGHTTVSGGIGTFYDSVPLNVYAFSHYPEQIITTFQPDGTVIGTPQHYLNLTAEAVNSGFPFIDRDHKIGNFAPYTIAWNFQAQHRFSEHLTVRAKYLESYGSGLITISPEVVQGQDAFVLAGNGSSKYRQLELTPQIPLQPGNNIYASYVRSLSGRFTQ